MLGFRIFFKGIRNIWEEMLPLGAMSFVTFLALALAPLLVWAVLQFQLPLVLLVLAVPLALPGPPAWYALHVVAQRVANGFAIRWDHFWEAFRPWFGKVWAYSAVSAAIFGLALFNGVFYANQFPDAGWSTWAAGAWLAVGVLWLALQLYVVPYFIEQEQKRWRTALRNAFLTLGAHPLMTLILLVLTVIVLVISILIVPPMFVVYGPIWWVMMGTTAVTHVVAEFRKAQPATEPGVEVTPEAAEDPAALVAKYKNRGIQ